MTAGKTTLFYCLYVTRKQYIYLKLMSSLTQAYNPRPNLNIMPLYMYNVYRMHVQIPAVPIICNFILMKNCEWNSPKMIPFLQQLPGKIYYYNTANSCETLLSNDNNNCQPQLPSTAPRSLDFLCLGFPHINEIFTSHG